ncbi:MAG: MFS transporter [Roseibacillus sp.]|nr:MFS transporter [Roseibacillus sp.]
MSGHTQPSLSNSPILRVLTLCSLYVSQGLPQGFIHYALKNHLADQGFSTSDIGNVIAMISLPWAVKFLWGPVVDRFGIASMGKRRPWIIGAQAMTVVVLLILATVPGLDSNLRLLGLGILSVNIWTSLQDVCTDSLAVDLVPENQRGILNGFMYGCSYLGSFLGGTLIGYFLLMEGGSVQLALVVLSGCVFAIMLLPVFIRERSGEKLLPWTSGSSQLMEDEQHARSTGLLFRQIKQAFSRPIALTAALLAVGAHIGNSALNIIASRHFITEVGWDKKAYTLLESGVTFFSLGGAFIGGFVASLLGAKRSVVLSGSLIALVWIIFSRLESHWSEEWLVRTNMCVLATLLGLFTVSLFTLFMNISDRRVAASQFTAYMALMNLSMFTGNKLAGPLEATLPSVPAAYLVSGIFHLGVMAFVILAIKPPRNPAELPPSPTGGS